MSQFMIFYYYLLLMLIIKHIIISINLIDSSSYHYCNQRRTFLAYSKLFEHLYSLVIKSGMFPFWNNLTVIRKHWNLATFVINTKHFILLTLFTYLFTTFFHFNADTKLCDIIIIQRYASNFRFCNIVKWMKV